MKRFTFRLQRVLDQRRREDWSAQQAVSRLQEERIRIELALQLIHQQRQDGYMMLRDGLSGSLDIDALRLQADISMDGWDRARELLQELAALSPRLETAREAAMAAAMRRKTLEFLQDRARGEWRRAVRRRERRDEGEALAGQWMKT